MFRISKLTDYAIIVMAYFARQSEDMSHNARDIAEQTHLALPTVTKILKILTREKLLISQRGINGGYSLACLPEKTSLATVIAAVEGNLGLTECAQADSQCVLESACTTRHNWRLISQLIYTALNDITLAEMAQPSQHFKFTLQRMDNNQISEEA